jgi:hypothetical protein
VQAHTVPVVKKNAIVRVSNAASKGTYAGVACIVICENCGHGFTLQRELEFITPKLLESFVLDDEHNIASARARLSKDRLPRPETLEKGQWYLQCVPEASSVKKCQALYSRKLCDATLPPGMFSQVMTCQVNR